MRFSVDAGFTLGYVRLAHFGVNSENGIGRKHVRNTPKVGMTKSRMPRFHRNSGQATDTSISSNIQHAIPIRVPCAIFFKAANIEQTPPPKLAVIPLTLSRQPKANYIREMARAKHF
jgi:hypothetical protein